MKNNTIVLENVFPYSSKIGFLIGMPCFIFWASLYYIVFGGQFKLWPVMFFTGLCIATAIFIIKKMSQNVEVWFDDEFMFIQKQKKIEKINKKEVLGFIAYDYESEITKKSIIKFEFVLKNGRKIYLNDSEYKNKYEHDKGVILTQLLKKMKTQLGFSGKKRIMFDKYFYSN